MPMTVEQLNHLLRGVPGSTEVEIRFGGGEYDVRQAFDDGGQFVIEVADRDDEYEG